MRYFAWSCLQKLVSHPNNRQIDSNAGLCVVSNQRDKLNIGSGINMSLETFPA